MENIFILLFNYLYLFFVVNLLLRPEKVKERKYLWKSLLNELPSTNMLNKWEKWENLESLNYRQLFSYIDQLKLLKYCSPSVDKSVF